MASFAVACKKFFGTKEGQGLSAFLAEIRQLSSQDVEEIRAELEKHFGEPIEVKPAGNA